jgi:putative membrane protein
MISSLADLTRGSGAHGPLTWRTWCGLLLLPVLVMSLFLWAFWAPESNHGAAKAAVVNNDKPVTINGQPIPLGRQLASNLTTSTAPYTWVLTDADDARDGLARGDYGAVVTIPEDFSAKATSSASSNPLDAGQAEVRVQTSNATGVADPLVTSQIAQVVLRTLNQQIVQTYLDKVFVSFATIHDQLGKAADGASQLADGADKLTIGATQLADGTQQLASGLDAAQAQVNQVKATASGVQQQLRLPPMPPLPAPPPGPVTDHVDALVGQVNSAVTGIHQLNDGAHQLQGGLVQLSGGAHELATQLAQGRDQVPDYDQAQRDRVSNVAATPAVAVTDGTDLGAAVAAVAVTLALWAGALSMYISTRPLPGAVLTSRLSTRRIVAGAAVPGAAVAVLAAMMLSCILIPVLHLAAGRWFGLLGIAILTGLTFIALNQAATAVFHLAGRFACIAVLVLAVVTSLTSTIPPTLHSIGNLLPTHAAILALRGVIIGSNTVVGGAIELVVWMLGAVVVTLLVTERRRSLGGKQLRYGFVPAELA